MLLGFNLNKNMKKRFLLILTVFVFTLGPTSCSEDCVTTIATCNENIPNEDCLTQFNRWFFDKAKNNCEQISYSGCSQKGFATQQECEECKCR